LSQRERKNAILLMGMVLCMAFLDTLGVASILPFMAVLANPELTQTNPILNTAFSASSHLGIKNSEQFLFVLGVLVFVLFIISLVFKSLTTFAQIRFALMREYSIGKQLTEGYLHQPYDWFLGRHSADLSKTILSEVHAVVANGMIPIMRLLAHGTVAFALLVLLLFVDPLLSISVGLVLTLSYAAVFLMMSGTLKKLGRERAQANQERFKALTEAFGASKEVKVSGLEKVYVHRFSAPAKTYALSETKAMVIGQVPRFALEAIAFGGMLLVMLYLMSESGSFEGALPVIALYAFAGYRLMPSLQQVYGAITQLRFVGPALDAIYDDFKKIDSCSDEPVNNTSMSFARSIQLQNVNYRYPNTSRSALEAISLTIPAKSMIGFVGATGGGKTTLVDVILGLLEPESGSLSVDGQLVTKYNRRQWQHLIGYVPQHIYLAAESVAANIAFGVKPSEIDRMAVERAATIANLHDFVTHDLPQGYETIVGERGVRLSGGQRQRIGIARALYNNPEVLIFDEATSALDNTTEKYVMEAIESLANQKTIILIAHRLSTVKRCDQIIYLKDGKIDSIGSFDELMENCPQFKQMNDKASITNN